jgi:hypothetical protein
MGFLQICSGVVLLQLSKSSKNVPDTEIFRGDLDQIKTVAEQEEPESEPKADAIRGTAAIIRRISVARRAAEADEARRVHDDRMLDLRSPRSTSDANSIVEWDGVRRRVTFGAGANNGRVRRNTLSGHHPPLDVSISRIPDEEEARNVPDQPANTVSGRRRSMSVDEALRARIYNSDQGEEAPHPESFIGRLRGLFVPKMRSIASLRDESEGMATAGAVDTSGGAAAAALPGGGRPRVYSEVAAAAPFAGLQQPAAQSSPHIAFDGATEMKTYDFTAAASASAPHSPGRRTMSRDGTEYEAIPSNQPPVAPPSSVAAARLGDGLRPDSHSSARRQFSFQFLHRHGRSESAGSVGSDGGGGGRHHHHHHHGVGWGKRAAPPAGSERTEEEMLGLVKGDTISTQDTRRSESPSEKGGVRVVEDEDVGDGWNEKRWESRG